MTEEWNVPEIRKSVKEQIGELVTAQLISSAASDDGKHSEAEVAADRVAEDLELTDRQRILVRGLQVLAGHLVRDIAPGDPLEYWQALSVAMHDSE